MAAAWQLTRLGHTDVTLFEASGRLGGIVETVRRDGFVVELGPDGWVTDKPWATQLVHDIGLGAELIASNDATRVTWILRDGRLQAIPDGMRMMVPTDLSALSASPLFSSAAQQAYASEPGRALELQQQASGLDESVADFVQRHFGAEVLQTLAAPLLGGVFGGDVRTLSVRAVMPAFVAMEQQHGSLIVAMQAALAGRGGRPPQPIFTTLRSGTGTLIERMAAELPAGCVRLKTGISSVQHSTHRWQLQSNDGNFDDHVCDTLIVATPAHVTRRLLPEFAPFLPAEESSAIIAAFGFDQDFDLPAGFGFLVPHGEGNSLLAGTFVDQKYPDRAPQGKRLLRAFFGGTDEPANDRRTDEQLAAEAFADLCKVVGMLPRPAFQIVRRWPRSLPQYAVGHGARMAALDKLVAARPGLHLLGNAYKGVGLPDLIREARALARSLS